MTKACEKCSKEFECHAGESTSCWCFEIDLEDKTLRQLREKYGDCLCPDCLNQFSAQSAAFPKKEI